MTKTFSYFPGCSLSAVGISYAESASYVAKRLGIEFREIQDWNCCGTSAARITSEELRYALPARSLALSEQQNPGLDVVAPCTGCYASLKAAAVYARESEEKRAWISDLIEMDYQASADVKSLLEIMVEPDIIQETTEAASKTLNGLKVACYYGCAQVRPAGLCQFDNPENPTRMEALLNALGADCVDWAFKTECCGASNAVVSPDQARAAMERIFRNAQNCGAECIVTSCPMCWMNLDMRAEQINKEYGTDYHLPVYYFTELMALALDADPIKVGIGRHFQPAVDLVKSKVADKAAEPAPEEEAPQKTAAKAKAKEKAQAEAETTEEGKVS